LLGAFGIFKWLGMMQAKPLLKPIDAAHRLGRGLTRFEREFVLRDPADPFVRGTEIRRLEPIQMFWFWRGLRLCQRKKPMIVFVEEEVDALATALKKSPTGVAETPAGISGDCVMNVPTLTDQRRVSTHEE
jgi:hypothetical protein